MDIDFLKKCVEKAEGFELKREKAIKSPGGSHFYPDKPICNIPGGFNGTLSVQEMWMIDYYPHLIQKAIEGVNRDETNWTIWTNQYLKYIYANWKDGNNRLSQKYSIKDNIDEAKTAALKYVFRQEE